MSKKSILHLFICLSVPVLSFAGPLTLSPEKEIIPAGTYLSILQDSLHSFSFQDVRSGRWDHRFQSSTVENPNLGYSESAFWVRVIVNNEAEDHQHWVVEVAYPNLDLISFFHPDGSGGYDEITTGDRLPFSTREIKYRNFVFKLHLPTQTVDTLYFRFESAGAISIPIVFRSESNFRETDHESQLILGFYYGIFLSLILYNFLLFLSLRDKSYLLYVIFISAFLLLQMIFNGLAYEYLWPELPWWNNVALIFFIGMVYAFSLWFTTSFLNLKQYNPVFYKIMKGLRVVGVLISFGAFVIPYHQMVMASAFMTLLVAPSILIASIYAITKKYRPAWFFLIAWLMFLIGMTLFALKNFGVLPVTFITTYGIQIGAAIEIILLSLALGDRINLLKSELELKNQETRKLEQERFMLARQVTIGILHEIRQPLQIIRGILDVMDLPEETTKEEKKQYIFKAQKSVNTINQYLQRLEHLEKGYFRHTKEYTQGEKMIDLSGEANKEEGK